MRQDELMHYGVPGMKWGHRKALPTAGQVKAKMARRAKALPTAGQVKVKTKRSLQNFSKEYDKILRQDKNINMKSANARSKRIIETSNNAQKVAKHQNKIALREKSRYGQTNGKIVANSILSAMAVNTVSSIAMSAATITGHDYAAKLISNAAFGANIGIAARGAYKGYHNYR